MINLDNHRGIIVGEIHKIKEEDVHSIIFQHGDSYYLHLRSEIKYPMMNKYLYDNVLFQVKIRDVLVTADAPFDFFITSKTEKYLVRKVKGSIIPIFEATGLMAEIDPVEIEMENIKYMYDFFTGDKGTDTIAYSLIVSYNFNDILKTAMTLPSKHISL